MGCKLADAPPYSYPSPPSKLNSCQHFKPELFGPDSKSIFLMVPDGRLGNHLVAYSFLLYFKLVLGLDVYMPIDTKHYLLKVFTPRSVEIPVLEETFCNYEEIKFKDYQGHMRPILTDKTWWTGKLIWLWRMVPGLPNSLRLECSSCIYKWPI